MEIKCCVCAVRSSGTVSSQNRAVRSGQSHTRGVPGDESSTARRYSNAVAASLIDSSCDPLGLHCRRARTSHAPLACLCDIYPIFVACPTRIFPILWPALPPHTQILRMSTSGDDTTSVVAPPPANPVPRLMSNLFVPSNTSLRFSFFRRSFHRLSFPRTLPHTLKILLLPFHPSNLLEFTSILLSLRPSVLD